MFSKLAKNTFIGLLLLSYAATTISMEQSNIDQSATSQEQIAAEYQALAVNQAENWGAQSIEQEKEAADKNDSWASLSWWTKGLNTLLVAVRSYHLLKHWCAPYSYCAKRLYPS